MAQLATAAPAQARDLHRPLADGARGRIRRTRSAIESLAQLYERARDWEPLAKVLEKHVDQMTTKRSSSKPLQKLGMIYADKVGDDAGAVRAFQRLLDHRPQRPARSGAAQAPLRLPQGLGRARGFLRGHREVGRADPHPRARGRGQGPTETEEQIALLFRAARLVGDKKDRPERAARAYEKILDTDPHEPEAAEALSPIYEEADDAKKLVAVYEVRLEHTQDPRERDPAPPRDRPPLRREASQARRPPSSASSRRSRWTRRRRSCARTSSVSRRASTSGWDRVIQAYREAIEAATDEDVQIELRHEPRAAADRSRADRRRDRAVSAPSTKRSRDHHGAIAALGELYRRDREVPRAARDLRAPHGARGPTPRRAASSPTAGRRSGRTSSRDPDRAPSTPTSAILAEWGDDEADAYAALDRLYEQQGRWQDFAETLRASHRPRPRGTRGARRAQVPLGARARAAPRGQDRRRSTSTARSSSLPGARRRPRALETPDAGRGRRRARRPTILEPIYEDRQGLDGPHPRPRRSFTIAPTIPSASSSSRTRSARSTASAWATPRRRFDAFCKLLPRLARQRGHAGAPRGARRRAGEVPAIWFSSSTTSPPSRHDPILARSLWLKAAQIYDTQLENVDGAVGAYTQDPREGSTRDLAGPRVTRGALSAHRALA